MSCAPQRSGESGEAFVGLGGRRLAAGVELRRAPELGSRSSSDRSSSDRSSSGCTRRGERPPAADSSSSKAAENIAMRIFARAVAVPSRPGFGRERVDFARSWCRVPADSIMDEKRQEYRQDGRRQRCEPSSALTDGSQFAGRVIVVTGGGQGIGRAIAQRLLRAGATVCVLEYDEEAAAHFEASDGALGDLLVRTGDVSDERCVTEFVAATVRERGVLHGVVNNAGVSDPHVGALETGCLADWQRVIATNLTGPMLMVRAALPHLSDARGAVVNIASTRAHMSEPHSEAYAASKGGLVALTHAMALSLGPAIRVNSVSPGWIDVSSLKKPGRAGEAIRPADHEQHPVGRVGRPEDVASLVTWLLSDEAGFITGQDFIIDGGMSRKMIYV